jgi:peptidoglycan/LPS O-acetylase OafA/YrhL
VNLTPLIISKEDRIDAIDRIKLVAILSDILLHVLPNKYDNVTLAPFHIGQAVPLFMMLAGITLSLSIEKRGYKSVFSALTPTEFIQRATRIIYPFAVLLVLQLTALVVTQHEGKIFSGLKAGGYGPGSYFVWIYLQHLIIFPLIIFLDDKLNNYNFWFRALCWITISLTVDYACVAMSMPSWLFRLFYGRYILAAVIGRWLLCYKVNKVYIYLFGLIGIIYITAVSYFGWRPLIVYPTWIRYHTLSYAYTAVVFLLIWYSPALINRITSPFLVLGKASYHIFLVQMFYFWIFSSRINKALGHWALSTTVALIFCCGLGLVCFYCEIWLKKNLCWPKKSRPQLFHVKA